jgi:hypothetical protein
MLGFREGFNPAYGIDITNNRVAYTLPRGGIWVQLAIIGLTLPSIGAKY